MSETVSQSGLLIAGDEVTGNDVQVVRSPWDDHQVGAVPMVGAKETAVAVDAAAEAMRTPLPLVERAQILDRAAAEVRERRLELARMLSLEAGKPMKYALVEVDRCIQTLTFCAVEARTLAGRGVPLDAHPAGVGHRGFTIRVPIGVVGAITPFNFPLNLAAHKIGPAIAAGCGVVLKPAEKAPLTAIELVRILHRSGLPPRWLSVIVGPPEEVAAVFLADDRVRLIAFTGSSDVGWALAAAAPMKRVTLELGNSTPVIVCADADLVAAAGAVSVSGFAFSGQSCISAQRIIVDRRVHGDFIHHLIEAAQRLRLGDPLEPDTDLGPVISRMSRNRISSWIEEAVEAGAEQITPPQAAGAHIPPVILDGVDTDAGVWQREVFGPVVSVRAFDDLSEAFHLANGTKYGLQAGIFTRDLDTAFLAMERLEFGGIMINEAPTFRVDQMPYGGTKRSGNTREGPHFAIQEMTEERTIVLSL